MALLAVAIGGTAAVFSLTDTLMLRRLAVPEPGQLVRMLNVLPNRLPVSSFGYLDFEEWALRTRSLFAPFAEADLDVTLAEAGGGRLIRAGIVSPGYFTALGVTPALGRLPVADDERSALLSYRFWQDRFHGNPAALGSLLTLNNATFVVVGVLPRGVNGTAVESGPALRAPLAAGKYLGANGQPKNCCSWEIGGRLRPGVTLEQANAESAAALREAILAVEGRTHPLTEEQRRDILADEYRLESIEHGVSQLRTRFGTGLLTLFGGAALLLLLACANIAGLLLARAAGREREMALRAALGASRARLMRHWLAESAILTAAGGALGLLFARAALPLIAGSLPALRDLGTVLVPVSLDAALDGRAFAFTLALCGAAALLAGLAPAWHTARADLNTSLKTAAPDPRRARLRTLLTIAQVAIGTLVLAVSGLLVTTLHRLAVVPAGFDAEHIVAFTLDTTLAKYSKEQNRALAARLERDARTLPGVA